MDSTTQKRAHAITGAFGFTGKYLAQRLLDSGERVVTLTGSANRPDPFGGRVEARPLSFDNAKALAAALADVQVLYNTYWVRFNHDDFSYAQAARNSLILFEAAKKAGVERVVHISITNAEPNSPYEYFSAKGHLEKALQGFGLNHAVLRPAVLFGPEDILINNIAWAVRRFPLLGMAGDGAYRLRPIYVDDLAALMLQQGQERENVSINALGPEEFTYRELLELVAFALGKSPRLVAMNPKILYAFSRFLGLLLDDVLLTRDEIGALSDNLLTVPGAQATGTVALSAWVREHASELGKVYHAELDRRRNRDRAY